MNIHNSTGYFVAEGDGIWVNGQKKPDDFWWFPTKQPTIQQRDFPVAMLAPQMIVAYRSERPHTNPLNISCIFIVYHFPMDTARTLTVKIYIYIEIYTLW